jgi:S1-C subfamily serine protease
VLLARRALRAGRHLTILSEGAMVRPTLARVVILFVVAAGLGATLAAARPTLAAGLSVHAKDKRAAHADPAVPMDSAAIVERYGAAVVSISTVPPGQPGGPDAAPTLASVGPDDPFVPFFKRETPQPPTPQPVMQPSPVPAPPSASQPAPTQGDAVDLPTAVSGVGSGFIVSADGLIVTTAHVVDDAEQVSVRLADKRLFTGKVLGVDAASDVALVKIDASRLPTVKLGDSSRVRPGESVLAVGLTERAEPTVTSGIVSASPRTLPDGSRFAFFQTDLAHSPDNSGGPVFNRAGEVVGIAVEIYAGADAASSLTFAIPISTLPDVRQRLQTARATPAVDGAGSANGAGIDVEDVSPGLAAALGLPRAAGALVDGVDPASALAASGLKAGDIIVKVADKPIEHAADVADLLSALPADTPTAIKLVRNRKPLSVTVGAATGGPIAPAGAAVSGEDRLGLTMHPLSLGERRASDLPLGMMVDAAAGPAAKAGIRAGDIVLSLDDTLVETPQQVADLEAKAGKAMTVMIQRNHTRSFVSVKLR